VEIGTAVMTEGMGVYSKVAEGVREYLQENGFSCVKDIIGLAHDDETMTGCVL
jgi:dihydroorotate dehydrogenase (NAD+) catalytic subunit